MSATANLQKQVYKKLVADGTIARMDARKAQLNAHARTLGYADSQQACRAVGAAVFTAQVPWPPKE